MEFKIKKPEFVKTVPISPAEIRECRKLMLMTQEGFGRLFPVSGETIRSWESPTRPSQPYGPCNIRLQEIKAYTDQIVEERNRALKSVMERK